MELEEQKLPYLDPTWSVLDREPGLDDLAEGATEILKQMGKDLEIFPFQDSDGNDRLFLARYELPKFGEDFQISKSEWRALALVPGTEAPPVDPDDKPGGFIHFLAGFPIDCVEMLVAIGEISSKAKEGEDSKVSVQEGTGVSPPVPKEGVHGFFKWPEKDKILLNLTAIATKDVAKILAKNLEDEPKQIKAHWWFRVELVAGTAEKPNKWPVPGEFVGLGVRMFPGMYWGHQKSSPFAYSGNWMDTVYYTGARITAIIDPTDEIPYPTYQVTWRKDEITVNPSDFAEYKVDDRVTILKDVTTEKKSQLWKDDDMKSGCDKTKWQIVPITFYGLEQEG
jgi:hypothetical protein